MKMKKVIAVLCLVCLVFSFSTVAFAAEESMSRKTVEFSEVESAKMTYIESASNKLSIKNNVASIRASVCGYSGSTTKCEVSVKLQVKTLGLFWSNVETWSDSQYGDRASVSGSTAVTAGKSYRTVATVTVWNGSSSESRTLTSETIKA